MSLLTLTGASEPSTAGRSGARRAGYRLALSCYAGLALYSSLSLFFGPAGFSAYRRLEERKAAMQARLGELEAIREGLDGELESLKSDPDRAALEARSLGYLRKGETAVVLGEKIDRQKPVETGKVLLFAEQPALGDVQLKEISLGACLAMMALLLAPRGSRPPRKRGKRYATPS
jgi:cell division protein FtsB